MQRWGFRVFYLFLVSAICAAAGILGYYAYVTASQFDKLGAQSIASSTLLLVQEKVDRIEQRIIDADNAVFHLVDLSEQNASTTAWLPLAERISPSVRALLILDDGGQVVDFAARASPEDAENFQKLVLERMLPDLELERLGPDRLKHLQHTYGDTSYLISYRAFQYDGRRYYAILHHDTGYLIREVFPTLFANEEGKRLYNIVDSDNHRIYGSPLAGAGDYVIGRRFPTTLYEWRLQVAPKQAPQLRQSGRTRRFNEAGLIGLSFAIIFVGVAFLLYAADKERRLTALKGEFIANVTHELKTPLSVIRMFAEMLITKRVRNEEKEREYVDIIFRESERLQALIENVLDFAALERGKERYQLRLGNLSELTARVVETFKHRLEREKTELRLVPATDVPPLLLDEQSVFLALVNLLDNAVKYGDGSVIEIELTSTRKEVQVRVRDHGPGIQPDDLRRIFERFYRGRRSSGARGSGIGLALVKHIAEAHGGRAWAENAPGGGAVVCFSIARNASLETQGLTTAPSPDDAATTGEPQPAAATATAEPNTAATVDTPSSVGAIGAK